MAGVLRPLHEAARAHFRVRAPPDEPLHDVVAFRLCDRQGGGKTNLRLTRACTILFYQTWSVQRATHAACMSAVQRVLALVQFKMLGCVSKMSIICTQLKVFA